MPAKLNIHVGTKGTQTTSAYKVTPNDHVAFDNMGNANLTVTFGDGTQESPLCKNNNPTSNPLVIPPLSSSDDLKVCQNFGGEQFAYTAQIAGFAAEDPIVIIERTMGGGFKVDPASAFIGLGVGLLVGFFLTKLMGGGKARNPA